MAEDIFGKIGGKTGKEKGNGLEGAVDIIRGMGGDEEGESLGMGAQFLDFLKFIDELFPGTAEQMEEGGIETPQRNIFQEFLEGASEQKKLLQGQEIQSSLALPQIDLASLFTSSNRS